MSEKYPENTIYLAVNWYRRDTVKDLRTQNIPKRVPVVLDEGGLNTAEILKLNEKMLPTMIMVIDNNLWVEYIFGWNYDSEFEDGKIDKVMEKISGFMN